MVGDAAGEPEDDVVLAGGDDEVAASASISRDARPVLASGRFSRASIVSLRTAT